MCGAEIWVLWKVDQKYLESFEMWCWRKMEKISRNDRLRNEVLQRGREESNIVHTVYRRKANDWSQLVWELPSETGYWREGKRKGMRGGR